MFIKKKNANILVILDGLDEVSANKNINYQTIYQTIQQEFIKNYPNSKYIITTRLEAGYPESLNITDYYVRLFSFNDNQIKLFFENYGLKGINSLSNITSNIYEKISNLLNKEKLGKPLFCWMLATIYNSSSENERNALFDSSNDSNLAEVLLYQRFIHDIVWGKQRKIAKRDYSEWFNKSRDEKKALHLIAFLKTDKPSISKEKIEEILDNYKYKLPSTPMSLLTTYLSFSKTDDDSIEKIEFIHKSFQEYLLAEFYLESIINGRYYRLVGEEPTKETYEHLIGLVKVITSDKQHIKSLANEFIKSFYEKIDDIEEFDLGNFIKTLKTNSMSSIKQEYLIPNPIADKDLKIWNINKVKFNDLNKILFSKWISIFITRNRLLINDKDR